MREPAQAAVNVLEHEDVDGMHDRAQIRGMVDQIQRLENMIDLRHRFLLCLWRTNFKGLLSFARIGFVG